MRLFPHRCISLTAEGRPCWRRVRRAGERCDWCWDSLATSTRTLYRIEVAREPALPEWVVEILVVDPSPAVRMTLAARPDLSPARLIALGGDHDPTVVRQVAAHSATPSEVRAALCFHPDPFAARAARVMASRVAA
ncbi:MAG: hypothetical protein ACRD0J_03530 [Acidimicrobiales bacterium]